MEPLKEWIQMWIQTLREIISVHARQMDSKRICFIFPWLLNTWTTSKRSKFLLWVIICRDSSIACTVIMTKIVTVKLINITFLLLRESLMRWVEAIPLTKLGIAIIERFFFGSLIFLEKRVGKGCWGSICDFKNFC